MGRAAGRKKRLENCGRCRVERVERYVALRFGPGINWPGPLVLQLRLRKNLPVLAYHIPPFLFIFSPPFSLSGMSRLAVVSGCIQFNGKHNPKMTSFLFFFFQDFVVLRCRRLGWRVGCRRTALQVPIVKTFTFFILKIENQFAFKGRLTNLSTPLVTPSRPTHRTANHPVSLLNSLSFSCATDNLLFCVL